MDISEAVNATSAAASSGVQALSDFLAPIDPVLFVFACFLVGIVLGLALGRKKAFKDFFKMPSAHWRIRRDLKKKTP